MKQGVVPTSKSSPGRDQPFHHGPGERGANQARDARDRLSRLQVLDGLRSDLERDQLLKGGLAIGFSVGGVNFGLFGLAQGDAVVLDQLLVHLGKLARDFGGRQGLAISADGGGKVG